MTDLQNRVIEFVTIEELFSCKNPSSAKILFPGTPQKFGDSSEK